MPILGLAQPKNVHYERTGVYNAIFAQFISLVSNIPLSLYIHMPWCIKKCPYCDFNSHALTGEVPEKAYITALLKDLDSQLSHINGRPLQSIFIGGGTPSLFSGESYQELLQAIQAKITFSPTIEITLEANPSSVEAKRFAAYRQAGMNRLSLGVQSFQDSYLKTLGRAHDSKAAKAALNAIREAGFDNYNIDLMHGLPKQTVQDANRDIEEALRFSPNHLSWYQLTIEPNTYFYRYKPELPSEEALWDIEDAGMAILNQEFEHYEISAFAKLDKQAQHNLNYWRFGDYLGIGAGAHGKLTIDGKVYRTQKKRVPKQYLEDTAAILKPVNAESLAFEFMLNHTRLKEVIPKNRFSERTGLDIPAIAPTINKAINQGLLKEQDDCWLITKQGHRYLNNLQTLFLDSSLG